MTLSDTLDAAFAAIVTPAATGLSVYTGKSSEEKATPCVICSSEIQGDEDPVGTGNFWAICNVAIKQSATQNEDGTDPGAASPKAAAQAVTANIFATLMVDTLAASLTAAVAGLTVFSGSVTIGSSESGIDESGLWIDALHIRLYCCASTLT